MKENQSTYEVDLLEIIRLLVSKWWVIASSAILLAAILFSYTYFMVTPKYSSSALLYVNNSSLNIGSQKISINTSQIVAAQSLVATYCVILGTRLTLNDVIAEADLPYSYEKLRSMISASSENNTEIFRVTVTCDDPKEAALIANTIADVLPKKISEVVAGSSVSVVDYAVIGSRTSPNYKQNAVAGFIIGAILSICAIIFFYFANDKILSDDWLVQYFGEAIPMLAVIPDTAEKGGYRYGRSRYYHPYEPSK